MYAIGHFALGYLSGKLFSNFLGVTINLPLLFVISVIPDIDLIFLIIHPNLFMHRGPTHSLFVYFLVMLPFLIKYKKRAVPYFVALISHSLIGDFFTGGVQLLWPITPRWFYSFPIDVMHPISVTMELSLFLISLIVLYKSKDIFTFLKPCNHNWLLFIALGAVVGPIPQIIFGSKIFFSYLLLVPSAFYLVLFSYSIFIDLRYNLHKIKISHKV